MGGRCIFRERQFPTIATKAEPVKYQKHLGLYAYRKAALDRFPALPASALEAAERLEQLRFLEAGIDIYVEPTEFDSIGVDTEEDRAAVEEILLRRVSASK